MKNERKRILLITYGILSVLGLIFLGLAIFTEDKKNIYLGVALGSTIVANILNLIRDLDSKEQ